MVTLEVILLVSGALCIIASFFVGNDETTGNNAGNTAVSELSGSDVERIREQIDAIIHEQIDGLSEMTEAKLDKISNTKTLEFNEYAETVMSEINRNHNEAVFLYDMLNEKSKEVKNTVRDVNITKQKASHKEDADRVLNTVCESITDDCKDSSKTVAEERLMELAKKSAERSRDISGEANSRKETKAAIQKQSKKDKNAVSSEQPKKDKNNSSAERERKEYLQKEIAKIKNNEQLGRNDIIIAMSRLGMSNKDIAKEMNAGVGEVKLIVDLYAAAN